MINPATGNRIKMVTQDAETGEEVSRRDTVKGYEFKKNHYLIMTDEDFDKVKVESSSMMAVEKFVEANSIDPIYYDASYYLAPDGSGAEDVYAVLRDAIQKTGKVALTRVVISKRERTVAVRPIDGGMVAHTLNEERDLNSAQSLFDEVQRVKVDPEMVNLAIQLVDRQTGRYDPADLEDRYETRLRAMIDTKLKGEGESVESEPSYAESNVIDIMAALRNSLGQASKEEAASPTKPRSTAIAAKRKPKAATAEDVRRQPTFKLPIEGGQKSPRRTEKGVEPKMPEGVGRSRRKA
jgi:DNA end-binding protein Ku